MSRLLLLALASLSVPGRANAAGNEKTLAALADLAWMSGCWSGQVDGLAMEECWTAPGGGIMLGMHRDVAPSGKAFFEFLRIEASGDTVTYWASPMGKTPTPFRLKTQGPNRAVFENLAHDFPQRIIYWLEGEKTLRARVEGVENGAARQEEWQWRRTGIAPTTTSSPAR